MTDLSEKDPYDMNLMELKKERRRLQQESWMSNDDHARADLIVQLIGEKKQEMREAAESSIQRMY